MLKFRHKRLRRLRHWVGIGIRQLLGAILLIRGTQDLTLRRIGLCHGIRIRSDLGRLCSLHAFLVRGLLGTGLRHSGWLTVLPIQRLEQTLLGLG